MPFITMPAPKIGTQFYDKPTGRRTLYALAALTDNHIVANQVANPTGQTLTMPIAAWEKLTGYTIGPELLATMTITPPAPTAAAVAEPIETKPAKTKTTKAAKAAKPTKAAEAPAAPAAAPAAATISQGLARQLTEILKGQPVWMRLSGDSNADMRQKVMTALTGVKAPKSKCGINVIEATLLKMLGIDTTSMTLDKQSKLITARLNEIAAGAPAAITPEVGETPTLEPWQMTREEFVAAVKAGRDIPLLGVNPVPLSTLRAANDWTTIETAAIHHHDAATTTAFVNGVPVPDHVLADYPELAQLNAKRAAANASSPAAAPPLAPASIVNVGDGVELIVQPLRRATPAEMAAAEIVKPMVPDDAQQIAVEIRQVHMDGDPGDLTRANLQRLDAMVANIRNKKRADNGEIIVEMWAPDPQCAFGGSQHGPLAQYKIVAGHEQFQAIICFLEQSRVSGPIGEFKIPVMLTQPAKPAMTEQQIEQAIVAALEDFNEPISFTQPTEPAASAQPLAPVDEAAEAPNAEDYDDQGRLRPSAMNKKQVAAAIAELATEGWRLVERKEMGMRLMRLVHDERGLATKETVNERGLVRGTRLTGVYGPSEAYYREWLASTEQAATEPAPAEPAPAVKGVDSHAADKPAPVRYAWQNTITNINDLERRKRKLGKEAAALDEQDSAACQVITDEIEAIDRELESRQPGTAPAVLSEEEMLRQLQQKRSLNVQIAYNGKIVDMGYVTGTTHYVGLISKNQERDQLRRGAMRIYDNLGTVNGYQTGYIKTPRGSYYTVTRDARMAKPFVPPPLPAPAPAQPETKQEELAKTEAAAAHWEALAQAEEAAAQSEIDQGLPRGDVSSFAARADAYREVAADMWQQAAKEGSDAANLISAISQAGNEWWQNESAQAAAAAATPQTTIEAPTQNRIDVPINQLHFGDQYNSPPENELAACVQDLREYGPQNTDITACVWTFDPPAYHILSGHKEAIAAIQLKWDTVPITVMEAPCEPVHDLPNNTFVGHNMAGQGLYQDKHGVRTIIAGQFHRTEPVRLIPTLAGIEYGVDRRYRPEYKTRAELEVERDQSAAVAASVQASAHTTEAPRLDEEIAVEEQTVKGVESDAPAEPLPTSRPTTVASANPPGALINRVTIPAILPAPTQNQFTQPVQVMGVGNQITVAGAAMLEAPQPKVHYDPGKVDLLFGLYPPTKMTGHNFVNLGSSGSFIMPKETREGHSVVSDMLMQLGVDLARPQHFGTTLRSPIATTGAQGIIGYNNYADPLNGEANRFNRTSGLIESNQFLTWRCNIPGFWRIHIAYDASDTYTVRMWRALDPLISKAVGEVVEEFDDVYFPDLRRLVDLIYDHACDKYNNGAIDLDARDWAPLMNPNIPTTSSRPTTQRRR